jgi:hypothetical protein
VFKPTANFRLFWNVFVVFITAVQMFIVSIELFVDKTISHSIANVDYLDIENFFILIFLIDIVFNFNTGYYQSGDVILSRKSIAKQYLRTLFPYDIIAFFGMVIPTIYQFTRATELHHSEAATGALYDHWVYCVKLLYFLKFKELKTIFVNLEEYIFNEEKYEQTLTLCTLSLEILTFSHFLACVWIFVSTLSANDSEHTWLSKVVSNF